MAASAAITANRRLSGYFSARAAMASAKAASSCGRSADGSSSSALDCESAPSLWSRSSQRLGALAGDDGGGVCLWIHWHIDIGPSTSASPRSRGRNSECSVWRGLASMRGAVGSEHALNVNCRATALLGSGRAVLKSFGAGLIERPEQIPRLSPAPLLGPKLGKANGGAQFE